MSILRCFIVFSMIAMIGSMVRPAPELYFAWHGIVFSCIFVIFIGICRDFWLKVAICGIEAIAIVLTAIASAYMWKEDPTLATVHYYYKDALYVLLGLQLLAFATIRTRYKNGIIRRTILVGSDSYHRLSRGCDGRLASAAHNKESEA